MKKEKHPRVSYFCMEYGLHSNLRTYAGGLGILAGDYLKGAHDHHYPLVGIGIKWKQGYVNQMIAQTGYPIDAYSIYDYPFLKDTKIKVTVTIRRRPVVCKVWLCDNYNNAPLYLLDTDLPENEDPWITNQLYGGFGEERIAQEMVLGIGGVKALRALRIKTDIYHFNEGHALFAGFEVIRERIDKGDSFKKAYSYAKKRIIFTTHTPVIQGNESHPIDRLMYMGADNNCFTRKKLKELGGSPFNMTVAALRLARKSNAVSQLHAQTANKMWKKVIGKNKIIGITNALHQPTWIDPKMLSTAKQGKDLWKPHMDNKAKLLAFIKERTGIQLRSDVLTLGFSRRAVGYKRSDFIFRNTKRANYLFKTGKLQIVFSGKSHPLDDEGKNIVANLIKLTKKYQNAVVFLENYDMEIGSMLVRGVDVWLNNPRRPQEASGTSGMKAAMNGVLNLSILDGWWPEACQHGVNGWQIGKGYENKDHKLLDRYDLESLYKVLLREVIPTYYDDPNKWQEMMKQSILSTKDMFNMPRMLEEYHKKLYINPS